jgi:hypothetical protein
MAGQNLIHETAKKRATELPQKSAKVHKEEKGAVGLRGSGANQKGARGHSQGEPEARNPKSEIRNKFQEMAAHGTK